MRIHPDHLIRQVGFPVYIETGGYKHSDGTLKSYREMEKDWRWYPVPRTTLRRWVREYCPEIALEIAKRHAAR